MISLRKDTSHCLEAIFSVFETVHQDCETPVTMELMSGKVAKRVKMNFLLIFMVLETKTSFTNAFSMETAPSRTNGIETKALSLGAGDSSWEDDHRHISSINTKDGDGIIPARRDFLRQSSSLAGTTLLATATTAWSAKPAFAQTSTDTEDVEGFQVFKTESGLKYIELQEGAVGGSSKTPQYGQLCVISYTGYLQLPKDNTKTKFASQSGFVLKHGNGKMIPGLDEGLHTMKRGGRRRLIIPPKLGFVVGDLGPIPELPWERWQLNNQLTKMVEQKGGNLIYDVTLERFFDDEADQGYYQDDEISPEEFAELNRRLNRKNPNSGALDAVGDDIEVTDRDREKPIV